MKKQLGGNVYNEEKSFDNLPHFDDVPDDVPNGSFCCRGGV